MIARRSFSPYGELMFEAKHARAKGELDRASILRGAAAKVIERELVGEGNDLPILGVCRGQFGELRDCRIADCPARVEHPAAAELTKYRRLLAEREHERERRARAVVRRRLRGSA